MYQQKTLKTNESGSFFLAKFSFCVSSEDCQENFDIGHLQGDKASSPGGITALSAITDAFRLTKQSELLARRSVCQCSVLTTTADT